MFGQYPLQNCPRVQRHIDPSAVAAAGTRAGSPDLEEYQEHYAILGGSPLLNGDSLAAASSGRGRSLKGPNLVGRLRKCVNVVGEKLTRYENSERVRFRHAAVNCPNATIHSFLPNVRRRRTLQ